MTQNINLDCCFYCGGDLPDWRYKEQAVIVLVKSLKKHYPELVKGIKLKELPFCPDCYKKLNHKIEGITETRGETF